jgi:uncharacterized membrane protein
MKGFDQFHTTEYEEGAGVFLSALEDAGFDVTYIRAHEVSMKFPTRREDIDCFDVVILSDIGSNSFLLCDETFLRSERTVNRLALLGEYVEGGGGLLMVGGYMSFSGIDGRARYQASPLASILPVTMFNGDDRVEVPEGLIASFPNPDHPALGGTPADWPILLGYNKLKAKPSATVIASYDGDPLLVVEEVCKGRTVAFASDIAPHWAPNEFMSWPHYTKLFSSIVAWTASSGGKSTG